MLREFIGAFLTHVGKVSEATSTTQQKRRNGPTTLSQPPPPATPTVTEARPCAQTQPNITAERTEKRRKSLSSLPRSSASKKSTLKSLPGSRSGPASQAVLDQSRTLPIGIPIHPKGLPNPLWLPEDASWLDFQKLLQRFYDVAFNTRTTFWTYLSQTHYPTQIDEDFFKIGFWSYWRAGRLDKDRRPPHSVIIIARVRLVYMLYQIWLTFVGWRKLQRSSTSCATGLQGSRFEITFASAPVRIFTISTTNPTYT